MFPECWTSSYKSALVRPLFVSSLKNDSSCLNSSNVLMSSQKSRPPNFTIKKTPQTSLLRKSTAKHTKSLSLSSDFHHTWNFQSIEKINRQSHRYSQDTKLVVLLRRQLWSPKLRQHLRGILESIPQIVRVLHAHAAEQDFKIPVPERHNRWP